MNRARVAVIGGGWAGLAAAVRLTELGTPVTVFEASRAWGGRARRVEGVGGRPVLDNGQHILIGAYTRTLDLMRTVGVQPEQVLKREPLDLRRPDGRGIALSRLPSPWDALLAIARAPGWTWGERIALLRRAGAWRSQGFRCEASATVADLCRGLPAPVMDTFIEPLCVSALNLAAARASGTVFLRVLQDALFSTSRGSDLLLPCTDLGALMPDAAVAWLSARGAALHLGQRVQRMLPAASAWRLDDEAFDAVVLATPAPESARLVRGAANESGDPALRAWADQAQALTHTAIATVYAEATPDANGHVLPRPMVALASDKDRPAQFVFDRGRLGGPAGLLAFVVSDARGERTDLETRVLAQGRAALDRPDLRALRTLVERRAAFACTPDVRRPAWQIAPRLLAAGDHVQGPYPATLEGAVRSGEAAAVAADRVLRPAR